MSHLASETLPSPVDAAVPAAPSAYRALIVDDEPLARERLRSHLAAHTDFQVVAEGGTGREARELVASLQPDVVFLDIEMPDANGATLWRELRATAPATALVFVTAHSDFAVQGFELQAADYLLKPYNRERLAVALSRVRQLLRANNTAARPADSTTPAAGRIVLKRDGEFHFVPPSEIVRLEAQGDFVKVHTISTSLLVRHTLTRLQEQMPASFLRLHRSHLVNREHIAKISVCPDGDYSVTVTGGAVVPVARAQTDAVRALLG